MLPRFVFQFQQPRRIIDLLQGLCKVPSGFLQRWSPALQLPQLGCHEPYVQPPGGAVPVQTPRHRAPVQPMPEWLLRIPLLQG